MILARLLRLVLALGESSVAKPSKITSKARPGLRVISVVAAVFCDGSEDVVGSAGAGGGASGLVGNGVVF